MAFQVGHVLEGWRRGEQKRCKVYTINRDEEHNKINVKVTPVQALRLCTGRTTHRGGGRVIALPFHDHGTRRG